jgi:hypothetical protein
MRRRRPPAAAAPERLVRFAVSEWEGVDLAARLRAWKDARRAWHEAHGSGPWGDGIDRLVEERKVREQLRERLTADGEHWSR